MRCGFNLSCLGLMGSAALLVSSGFGDTVFAQQVPSLGPPAISGIITEYSVGVLNGKAQEFVYNPNGSTGSRLDWTMTNVVMFNAGASFRPLPWLVLGINGSTNLEGAGGKMGDYDFDTGFCPPSTPVAPRAWPWSKFRRAQAARLQRAAPGASGNIIRKPPSSRLAGPRVPVTSGPSPATGSRAASIATRRLAMPAPRSSPAPRLMQWRQRSIRRIIA